MLSDQQTRNLLERGFTRRHLARVASLLTTGAALPFYNEAAMAQESFNPRGRALPPGAVRISSNENPLGPCPEAIEAISSVARFGGRYSPHGEQAQLIEAIAETEGLKPDYIVPYAGSSDPLQRAVCAFVSAIKSYVMGDPGYEAGSRTASFLGAKVYRVPLRKDYSHDVQAMVKAAPNAGMFYICNPNNPTGTLTQREDIEWLLSNKPKDSILLLDEAYIHFSPAPLGSDLVAKDKDVILLRTFSKAYGMAGIRAGMALGRPDLLEKMRPFGVGFLPITGLAAATASLKVKGLVAERRKINADVRENVFNWLEQKKFTYVPSVSNTFMLETAKPGMETVEALRKENVYIGRVWPAWPTHVRVTIGTQDEMNKFQAALLKVTT